MTQNIATNPEQSRRLIACGVDPKTADMYWHEDLTDIRLHALSFEWKENLRNFNFSPAWSTSRLLELLPEYVDEYWLTIQKIYENGRKYTYALGYLRCKYQDKENPDGRKVYSDNYLFSCASETIIEACVKAIEWLTKEGYKLNEIEE